MEQAGFAEVGDRSGLPLKGAARRAMATRERLLKATVACLARDGYRAMSTNDVVREAGASRGALAHHFPSKMLLIQGAVEYMIRDASVTFQSHMRETSPVERKLADAADILWSFFEDPTMAVIIEMMVASRTDDELQSAVAGVPEHIMDTTLKEFCNAFPDVAGRPFTEPAIRAIVALYIGLKVQVSADNDAAGRHRQLRATLLHLLDQVRRDPVAGLAPPAGL